MPSMPKLAATEIVALLVLSLIGPLPVANATPDAPLQAIALDPSPPAQPVRLVFIHHSTGGLWLQDGLRSTLNANHYFVTETDYGWGDNDPSLGDVIGNRTDIGNWWNWFSGPYRDNYLADLAANDDGSGSNSGVVDPGGPNTIVMFKSCFPNSNLAGNPTDPPVAEGAPNPLRGESAGSAAMTVANAKGIYRDLLSTFSLHQDRLFVAITAPPLVPGATSSAAAANARAFNEWLVHDWLTGYPYPNVAVFDFYNVLTSNGGNANTNDLGAAGGNHHRYRNSQIEHQVSTAQNTAAYPTGDSHPSAAGSQKAAAEFVPLLNIGYHRWLDGSGLAVTKSALLHRADQNDAVPFVLTIRRPVAASGALTLTDVLPDGLAYVGGTLTATTGVVDASDAPVLRWTGMLSPTPLVTIDYTVQVTWPDRAVLTNTAVLTGANAVSATAAVWVNPVGVFLPLVTQKR
jgi:hypothetical protein